MTIKKAAEIVVKECFAVKKNEKVLIIIDKNTRKIGKVLLDESKKASKNSELIETKVGKMDGEEPPYTLAKAMLNADVIIAPTTKSLSHTDARRDASKKGARIATMPGITEEMFNRCVVLDYKKLRKMHDKLRKILLRSKSLRITTKKGTDVITSVHNVHGYPAGIILNKGAFDNIPTGEVDSGVKESSTNGIIVVDACIGGIGKLKSPLKITIKDGIAVDIQGKQANQMKKILDKVGKGAYKIAELGIGTNPKAKISGNVLEDEKVLGTVHLALGNDLSYGGKNNVPIHLDGIITKPTIFADKKMIMKEGEFVF